VRVETVFTVAEYVFFIVGVDVEALTSFLASAKEMFLSVFILQISASRIHIGHSLEEAIWSPLQLWQ
jgi:hypothetical protein